MNKLTIILTQILVCGLLAAPAAAQFIPQATAIPGSAPEGINYQGRLEDGGFPVNATKSMLFRVYSAPVGGVLLWTSPEQAVPVALGLFSAVVPVPTTVLVGGGARYLEVSIDSTLMAPRELLNSVPYALIAKSVEGNIDVSTAGLSINANSTAPQPALYISSVTGNVGIGTGSPVTAFDVGGSAQFGSGTTKSTFSATGALNTAGKVTAPDYTATYGINASTAVFTYILASSMTTTGSVNVQGRIGVGTPNPVNTLDILSSGPGLRTTRKLNTVGQDVGGATFGGCNAANATFDYGLIGANVVANTAGSESGRLRFYTSNAGTLAVKMVLDETGNVGIGTNLPSLLSGPGIDVVGDIKSQSGQYITGRASNISRWVTPSGGAASMEVNSLRVSGISYEDIAPSAGNLIVEGNVGIGTTSPAAKLHMSSGTLMIDGNASTGLQVFGSTFVVLSNGRVGIGTINPATSLSVTGTTNNLAVLRIIASHPSDFGDGIEVIGINNGSNVLNCVGCNNYPAVNLISGNRAGGRILMGTDSKTWDFYALDNDFLFNEAGSGTRLVLRAGGNIGIGTTIPASKLHMSSGTVIIDGNAATALTTVGNAGIGTGGSTPNDRLEVAGGNVRLTAVAGAAGSVKLFSTLTVGAVACTAQCGANTFCLAAWDSAGAASTCGTTVAANRCLCSGFGN